MNNGRGWNRNAGNWDRNVWERQPVGFSGPSPMYRGGFSPRGGPPAFARNGPANWRGGMGGRRGGPRGGGSNFSPNFGGRGGVNKRYQKFPPGNNRNGKQQWKNNKNNKPKKDTPGKRLSEDEIGVTQYISEHEGFNGIIKSRYADFQVSEINQKGEIAKLTDQTVPEPPKREEIREDEELLLNKYNLELLPMETWDKINSLAVCSEPTTERVEVDVTGMTKEHRTKVHDAVKKAFGDAIVGSTVTTDEKKLVRFEKYRKGVRIDNRVKWVWPGDYVHFILHKENCDTMDAASRIAERLMLANVKPSMLGYSGTKDRRAKSSQWFSLRKVEPRRIATACKDFREIHVGNFYFSETHLKLGMLKGNRFRIALRNVTVDDEIVNKSCENLREQGFINYYGLQRFGTRVDTPTYTIGLKLLQGNFKEAINDILEVRSGPMQVPLQKYRDSADAAQACKLLKRYCHKTLEGRLLRALAREPNDLVGALNKLARNTRLLYVHSYQSLIWNRCVSERLRRQGLSPAVGDLVLLHPAPGANLEGDEIEHGNEDESDDEEATNGGDKQNTEDIKQEVDTDAPTDPTEKPEESTEAETEEKSTNGTKKEEKVRPKIPVNILTQEDVDSGKYKITDIILPLPGFNIEYPTNIRDYYEELLAKDSVTMDMRHKIKSYSMSGAYRHIVVKPEGLEWSCVRYNDPYGDLILSDLDELQGKSLTSIVPDGKYKALLLKMSLPASCYATMALRELLRVDTSGDSQAQQNNYHKEDNGEAKTETQDDGIEKGEPSAADENNDSAEMEPEESEPQDGAEVVDKRKLEDAEAGDATGPKKAKTE